ncbi:hypothetical protein AVDCRST_MAG94-3156 [uncultured Leptolyngbya sp.]|uniref:Uncharacterized protein n=1 Tax=uncultured Leptolyngbya sp. TaxID=332963 RepID=A0A6J4MGW0_9CYAN|nr:hypothetical protein AVDCRST_MAG94-3156 [uncultured Leptolyngbya sp.]
MLPSKGASDRYLKTEFRMYSAHSHALVLVQEIANALLY